MSILHGKNRRNPYRLVVEDAFRGQLETKQRSALRSEHEIRFGHFASQVQIPDGKDDSPRVVSSRVPSQDDAEAQEWKVGEGAQCHAGRPEAALRGQRTAKFREQ